MQQVPGTLDSKGKQSEVEDQQGGAGRDGPFENCQETCRGL